MGFYNFDFLHHTVFDAMHNIPLNVVSRNLRRYRDSKTFDVKELDARLQSIPWPSGKCFCFCHVHSFF